MCPVGSARGGIRARLSARHRDEAWPYRVLMNELEQKSRTTAGVEAQIEPDPPTIHIIGRLDRYAAVISGHKRSLECGS